MRCHDGVPAVKTCQKEVSQSIEEVFKSFENVMEGRGPPTELLAAGGYPAADVSNMASSS